MTNQEKFFQWKKGEHYAKIETIEKEITLGDIDYYIFKSGRQINKEVINEFMVQLESPDMPLVNPSDNPNIGMETSIKKDNGILNYPSIEELGGQAGQEIKLGKAEVIPHPDDMEKTIAFKKSHQGEAQKSIKSISNDMNMGTVPFQSPVKNPMTDIINKAKKEKYVLNLEITVSLPVKHFFDLLDEDFVKNNKDIILNEMINKIKREDLDTQLKNNLTKIYNIQECTTENQEEK